MAQAIMADVFPPEKRGQAFALYGLTAVVAPALWPMLRGWITDRYSWRSIFLINVPIDLLLWHWYSKSRKILRRFKLGEVRLDYIGFAALVLGVAALQIFLDKGQQDDWLSSSFIATLAVVAVIGLPACSFGKLSNSKTPILPRTNDAPRYFALSLHPYLRNDQKACSPPP
jgi:MFS transporter, DHA2 family, multidrug resistance protein